MATPHLASQRGQVRKTTSRGLALAAGVAMGRPPGSRGGLRADPQDTEGQGGAVNPTPEGPLASARGAHPLAVPDPGRPADDDALATGQTLDDGDVVAARPSERYGASSHAREVGPVSRWIDHVEGESLLVARWPHDRIEGNPDGVVASGRGVGHLEQADVRRRGIEFGLGRATTRCGCQAEDDRSGPRGSSGTTGPSPPARSLPIRHAAESTARGRTQDRDRRQNPPAQLQTVGPLLPTMAPLWPTSSSLPCRISARWWTGIG